ncbi:uncharacterized protein [Aegilops tauschii subsp. strangulata]|uniref:uncharacterized protein n=1 Tax=Aegilops tauschii subsp. strangulata TaxID=200361 RepID=UPI003CC87236
MKKTTPFEWNDQVDEAFRDLKCMLSTAPVLAAPAEKEPLLLYIAATSRSVSTVMVVEQPEKVKIQAVQCPVYYLSEVLSASKQNYPHYQKMCCGVYLTAKKLKQYFQEHVVTIISTAPSIHFAASNNVAEYEALVHGLRLAKELGIQRILCYGDSNLVVQQCSGEWDARDPNMESYRFLVQKLSGFFTGCEFLHIPRAENEAADTLAKIASSRESTPSGVSLEHLHKPSVKTSLDSESIYVPDDPTTPQPGPGTTQPGPGAKTIDSAAVVPDPGAAGPGSGAAAPEPSMVAVFAVVTAPSWALPILEFLKNGVLPMDGTEAWQVQRRASPYSIINNELIKRSSTGVFQRCVEQDKGIEILLDIHQDRSRWHDAFAGGGGQVHQMDRSEADQETGWANSHRFVKEIAVRYGMPNSIITDNGTNFAKGALTQYCSVFGIRLDLASVAHLQSNGQVERANGLIQSSIKPRLVEPLVHSPGSWLDELPALKPKKPAKTASTFSKKHVS